MKRPGTCFSAPQLALGGAAPLTRRAPSKFVSRENDISRSFGRELGCEGHHAADVSAADVMVILALPRALARSSSAFIISCRYPSVKRDVDRWGGLRVDDGLELGRKPPRERPTALLRTLLFRPTHLVCANDGAMDDRTELVDLQLKGLNISSQQPFFAAVQPSASAGQPAIAIDPRSARVDARRFLIVRNAATHCICASGRFDPTTRRPDPGTPP
jgi:hypothetical protein